MRVKIISTGHPLTTRIIDTDTGQDIPYVNAARWELRAGEKEATVTLEFAGVPVEIEGPAEEERRIEQAAALASLWVGVEGTHHLRWVLDQMLRRLLADGYEAWMNAYNEQAARDDCEEWDAGIAP